jgi:periplasmic protein TonB
MAVIRVAISAALGVLVTFALIILMYKLIDSGNKDLDEKEAIKIPEFVQVDRDLTENVKQTQIEKPEDPETPPPDLPDDNIEFEVPENAISMAAPAANANLKLSGTGGFARDSDYIPCLCATARVSA